MPTPDPAAASKRGQSAAMVHHPNCPDPQGVAVCDCGANVTCSSCGWGRGAIPCRCTKGGPFRV